MGSDAEMPACIPLNQVGKKQVSPKIGMNSDARLDGQLRYSGQFVFYRKFAVLSKSAVTGKEQEGRRKYLRVFIFNE